MNYRHSYHAGNFADCVKHLVLTILLDALQIKDAPLCYIDTHAGCGIYDLNDVNAQRTGEHKSGITKLYHTNFTSRYFDVLRDINLHSPLRYYPGSPLLARKLLRPQDRMAICEFHPEDAQFLKDLFKYDAKVGAHFRDGYEALKAFLPPKEKRGLVLIDPPFESNREFANIFASLQIALKHWRNGVYAIWYPIKVETKIHSFIKNLKSILPGEMLQCEFLLQANDVANRLNGCGMLIINPPWQTESMIREALVFLKKHLGDKHSSYSVVAHK